MCTNEDLQSQINDQCDKSEAMHQELKAVKRQLVALSPLTSLIQPLQDIVDSQKAMQKMGKWGAAIGGGLLMVLGSIYYILKIFFGK
jgi:hypothetical protein